MKMHWFGARDDVDHSLCGGCDDDADCTYNDWKLSTATLVFGVLLMIASVAIVLCSCTLYVDKLEGPGHGVTHFNDPACAEDSGVIWAKGAYEQMCGTKMEKSK